MITISKPILMTVYIVAFVVSFWIYNSNRLKTSIHRRKTAMGYAERAKYAFDSSVILHEPLPCDGSNQPNRKRVTFLAAVISKNEDFAAREAIRQTWGSESSLAELLDKNQNNAARLIFVLAANGKQKQIDQESAQNGDILQTSIQDAYGNLTLMVLSALRWFKSSCSEADYMLKIDDDVFLNPFLLRHRVIDRIRNPREMVIYGRVWKDHKPFREPKMKWYVSPEEYPKDNYPPFVSGPLYLLTGPSVPALYDASAGVPIMPLEDVFVTGIVAESVGIPVVGIGQQFYDEGGNIGVDSEKDKCAAINSFVGIHQSSPSLLYELWELLWQDHGDYCRKYTWSDKGWSLVKSHKGRVDRKPKITFHRN